MGSRKARTLLALLGVRGGRMVAVDRIIEALWAAAPPRRPEANVATLVSRLRAKLGTEAIIGGRGGYRLGDTVEVDLHEAATLVVTAESCLAGGQAAPARPAAERAVHLLDAGPLLAGYPFQEWAEQARAMQVGLLRRAWHAAAEGALGSGAHRRAQVLAETAIAADGWDEAAYRLLMRAHLAAGEPARAIMAYQRLRTMLATELGTDPAIVTRDLHVAILRTDTAAV